MLAPTFGGSKMYVPVWVIVALVVWFSMGNEERDGMAKALGVLMLIALALIVLAVVCGLLYWAGLNAADLWAEHIPHWVNGVLVLIGLVLYVAFFVRECRKVRKDQPTKYYVPSDRKFKGLK